MRVAGRRIKARVSVRWRAPLAVREPVVTPLMGPPNRAPGVPIMGLPGRTEYPVMGRGDAGPRVGVMGAGDSGIRIDLLGTSSPDFVDSLFAPLETR